MSIHLKQIKKSWIELNKLIRKPKNDKQLNELIELLDELLDEIGTSSKHELLGLVDLLSYYIEEYEQKHINEPEVSGVDMLKFLMQSNNLKQSDLKEELGSQGVVSEILNGKRKLNLEHIKALARRFNVSVSTFIETDPKKFSRKKSDKIVSSDKYKNKVYK